MISSANDENLETDPVSAKDPRKRINEITQRCPYCGSDQLGSDLQTVSLAIFCKNCGARGPTVSLYRLGSNATSNAFKEKVQEAIAKWDQRDLPFYNQKIKQPGNGYRPKSKGQRHQVTQEEIDQLILYAIKFFVRTQPKLFELAPKVNVHPAALRLALRMMDKLCAMGNLEDPRLRPEYFDVVEALDVDTLVDDILKNADMGTV